MPNELEAVRLARTLEGEEREGRDPEVYIPRGTPSVERLGRGIGRKAKKSYL